MLRFFRQFLVFLATAKCSNIRQKRFLLLKKLIQMNRAIESELDANVRDSTSRAPPSSSCQVHYNYQTTPPPYTPQQDYPPPTQSYASPQDYTPAPPQSYIRLPTSDYLPPSVYSSTPPPITYTSTLTPSYIQMPQNNNPPSYVVTDDSQLPYPNHSSYQSPLIPIHQF